MLPLVVSVWSHAGPAHAQFTLSLSQRAADGTVYQVISVPNAPLFLGVDELRITTVAGGPLLLTACSAPGAAPGTLTRAISGADPSAFQLLHPYTEILRTTVLTPDDSTVTFDPCGSGRLTIGNAARIDICREAINCAGGATRAAVVPLSTEDAVIPAACVASGVRAGCTGGFLDTFAFGVSADANHNCLMNPTTDTTVCGARPADGFTVGKGQFVVFIYDGSLSQSAFTIAASGFGIEQVEPSLIGCPANTVVTADAQTPSSPPPPLPTPTATPTATLLPGQPTYTPAPTVPLPPNPCAANPTDTPTTAPSPTPTSTPTATPTFTLMATPTETPTPLPCVGDCDTFGTVTVDELIIMVNVALETQSVAACTAGDANHDNRITVDEIVTAVNNALTGCGPTPAAAISITPSTLSLGCEGSFAIAITNTGAPGSTLEISSLMLAHGYSQGYYGTGFSWDMSHITVPASLTRGAALTIPVTFSAAGQASPSRLELTCDSNAAGVPHLLLVYFGGSHDACAPTRTPTITPTPIATPTCAPTGTPYCSDNCQPCPTIRPFCYTVACGACMQNPLTCDPGTVRHCDLNTFPPAGCCSCVTPTSTPTETPTGPTATATPTATGTPTGTPASGVFAYVGNAGFFAGEGSISVINTQTGTVTATTIPGATAAAPFSVALANIPPP